MDQVRLGYPTWREELVRSSPARVRCSVLRLIPYVCCTVAYCIACRRHAHHPHDNRGGPTHFPFILLKPLTNQDRRGTNERKLTTKWLCAQDGTLLKPSKPLSLIDSGLAATSAGRGKKAALPGPSGEIYSTYSATTAAPGGIARAAIAYYFVSFKMTAEFGVSKRDFYPALPTTAKTMLVYREFSEGAGCVNGSVLHTCVTAVSSDTPHQIFTAPRSDLSNVTGGTDFAPAVFTVWPVCENGFVLLGDLSKYVALSAQRFSQVECTSTGVAAMVVGSTGEEVTVTALTKTTVVVRKVVIPPTGSVSVVVN